VGSGLHSKSAISISMWRPKAEAWVCQRDLPVSLASRTHRHMRPSKTWGACWRFVGPEGSESGMIRDRDDLLALFYPQVLDGLSGQGPPGRSASRGAAMRLAAVSSSACEPADPH
jgi:hypothetical protein